MTRKEEIQEAAEKESNELFGYVEDDFTIPYKKGAEWADKTMIEKACEWLDEHLIEYWSQKITSTKRGFLSNFIQAMEK